MGGGRSTLRMVRIGALVLFLILAVSLHGRGSTYNVLHVVYIAIILVVLVLSFASRGRRSGRGDGRGSGGGGFDSGPPGPMRTRDNPDPESGF
jgi:hypothetical protein